MSSKLCNGPHDSKYTCAPIAFSIVALVLSAVATSGCKYAFRNVEPEIFGGDPILSTSHGIGLFYYKNSTGCVRYPDNIQSEFDGKFRAAQIFSIVSITVGFFATVIMSLSVGGLRISRVFWVMIGICLLITCLFQGLTLIVLNSSMCSEPYQGSAVSCSITELTKASICAIVFWFLAGFSFWNVCPDACGELEEDDDRSNPDTFDADANAPLLSSEGVTA
mmetsp:Transcript_7624/g.11058  ORF Transcript_7624/g.11058 Transcript_7624/m.11058 type:complete len:221 (-) Transcript_7624:252-914(-)|eukprot:CAMPEP_0195528808 /NCGR_PEP_ID=MMETSP0794_2-20130614/31125_1 /TAXON_ID=515487 /ORGANISM="Stephanopyxis turris, Strain CCMP 815" /LENGTH=220 /DNA_ID=CAMNT_0040659999 /DNA_START=121 /DNA_END=783 /DNA_ORIENTATION=-